MLCRCMLILAILSGGAWAQDGPTFKEGAIICCEQAEARVLLLDVDADWNEEAEVLWSWSAKDCPDMSARQAKWFHCLTDAKWVLGGSHVLVSASGGGVALIHMAKKRPVFFGYAGGNTHSVEILPDGAIVSASSTGGFLGLFSRKFEKPADPRRPASKKVPMEDAHGLAWDHERECLWALGGNKLKRYRYNNNAETPDLEEEASFDLPEQGGHDLFPVPGHAQLFLTMGDTWVFDVASGGFTKYEPASSTSGLKSISQRGP
ncbi:MAG: hypothetical protein GY851_19110, partial [bacterium]|nr:hypothetical protein [bacterium]